MVSVNGTYINDELHHPARFFSLIRVGATSSGVIGKTTWATDQSQDG